MDAGIIFNAWPICNILVWLLRGGEQLNVLDEHPAILVEACAQEKANMSGIMGVYASCALSSMLVSMTAWDRL